ncbi:uncharacterized protein PV09_02658 [Verruconis gallopava]|uniref:EKC/KEOPS complex subunit GON7 n=1 Tax=Verruconis gallopava TaxID=253628 RepID=A0A0D1YZN7_9PEZI|nr:uncharacterized protein PV09_02658 [Verruconis gallopava]KIW06172.1 hypothetical protein PV09_02658 [Verruconis gallopava]
MAIIEADYTSLGADSDTFKVPVAVVPAQPNSEERTTYLACLRASLSSMQDSINVFLTRKMEEENRIAGTDATQDAKEEEQYGEETVEES